MRTPDSWNAWSRSILRLSGQPPARAPERKSDEGAAAVFRRFFSALARLERRRRDEPARKTAGRP
jgi:hypothetical protein